MPTIQQIARNTPTPNQPRYETRPTLEGTFNVYFKKGYATGWNNLGTVQNEIEGVQLIRKHQSQNTPRK